MKPPKNHFKVWQVPDGRWICKSRVNKMKQTYGATADEAIKNSEASDVKYLEWVAALEKVSE